MELNPHPAGTDDHASFPDFFWAKTVKDAQGRELGMGISVRDHCLNVGCVADALLTLLPTSVVELLRPALSLIAGHDVGKISPDFLKQCSAWIDEFKLRQHALAAGWPVCKASHSLVSQWHLETEELVKQTRRWAQAAGAHHGRVIRENCKPPCLSTDHNSFREHRRKLIAWLVQQFGPLPVSEPTDAELCLVAGLTSVADWIGSDEKPEFFPPRRQPEYTPDESHERAKNALAKLGWVRTRVRKRLAFKTIFEARKLRRANELQKQVATAVTTPGLYLVEAPMGLGKTEAALLAAYRLLAAKYQQHHGLYFALPTQVTSDRIHERVQEFVAAIQTSSMAVKLIHGSSWLREDRPPLIQPAFSADDTEDDDESEESAVQSHARAGRDWFASSKRALLASFGVGTVDQALLGIVAAKHFFVRQFALAGKIVILDEVHAYDPYTSALVDALIKRCLNLHCTVLVLSGTLTSQRRNELLKLAGFAPVASGHHTLVTGGATGAKAILREVHSPKREVRPKTVRVTHQVDEMESQVAEALRRAKEGACVLWIRNTVARAQDAFRWVSEERKGDRPEVALLHSRFPHFQSPEQEALWIDALGKPGSKAARPNGCVVIATQVVEQSVDIDADFLISDLAPTDMLFQRLGRLWRHPRGPRPACPEPELWLIETPVPDTATAHEVKKALSPHGWVYPPYHLLRTWRAWRELSAVKMPEELRLLLEETFGDSKLKEPGAWKELREKLGSIEKEQREIAAARTRVFANPALQDTEGIQTRWGQMPASLVMVRSVRDSTTVTFLNGVTARVSEFDWSFPVAKQVFLNAVPISFHILKQAVRTAPAWLKLHARGAALAIKQDDGTLKIDGLPDKYVLTYCPALGVVIDRKPMPHAAKDEDYDDELGNW